MADKSGLHASGVHDRNFMDEPWNRIPVICSWSARVDRSQFEAGYMDGVKNRWQELWYITLPNMKPMLMFGAVMSITQAFGVCDVTMALCGYPSTDYAARTVVTHLFDYGFSRFEMGYASAIATMLFLIMILCNKAIQKLLGRVGT